MQGKGRMKELQLPVENWLKFLSTQAGRDKVYRFVQYFARFLSYHLKTKTGAIDIAVRLNKLSLAVGAGRKCNYLEYSLIIISI